MGILIGIAIILIWGFHLIYSIIYVKIEYANPLFYIHILLQGYLFTGLFITAHDAMHGTVSRKRKVNNTIGRLSAFLFAGFSYNKLLKNHHLHHRHPCTEEDPDYCTKSQNFFIWFFTFIYRYITIMQIIIIAIIFNLLSLINGEAPVWFFFVIPSLIGTFQLFYFGTYLTHRMPHTPEMMPHKARTLKKNHFLAMLTCYFFGYHSEHHRKPYVQWWHLYKTKL
jgi:beta-carotene ketolase (CrtW type)